MTFSSELPVSGKRPCHTFWVDSAPDQAAAVVERHPCPECGEPAGSPCRTGDGKVAARHHIARSVRGGMPVLNRRQVYRDLAGERGIPEHVIDTVLLRLARPRIELRPAGYSDGPVVGRYGGRPPLPVGAELPVPDFIASVDCAALPAGVLDIPLPEDGHLLFFGNKSEWQWLDNDTTGRVMHVPAGTVLPTSREDDDDDADEAFALHGHVDWNMPAEGTFAAVAADEECKALFDEYELSYLDDSVPGELTVGGHACPTQDDPCLGRWPGDDDEAWLLLAQARYTFTDGSDFDAVGFWMIRRQDLAARNFGNVMYVIDFYE